jgi:hypothetical protein
MNPTVKRAVLILNTLGFVFYLVWLTQFDTSETLRSSDGIIFYIPCVPFLFVYMLMMPQKVGPKGKPWWQSDEDYEKEQAAKQKASAPPPPPTAGPPSFPS